MPKSLLFESQTCTRCGGSGKYSYCHRYADRCFKCQGYGVTLTKRGQVAQAFFRKSLEVQVSALNVGDLIRWTGVTHGGGLYEFTAPIESIQVDGSNVTIEATHPKFGRHSILTTLTATVSSYMDRKIKIAAALAFQNSLTKAGTVRKNSAQPAEAVQGE